MTDHLWPARAEYLRRGTPIQLGSCGLAVVLRVEGDEVYVYGDRDKGGAGRMIGLVKEVLLDLRYVTARAHAAWAYTSRLGEDLIDVLYGAMADDIEATKGYKGVLLLAAHGYEPPTDVLDDFIALLRAALEWAEGVRDGQ